MAYSQSEVVAAIHIITVLTTKTPKLEKVFHQDATDISSELDNAIKEHDRLELAWHAEVEDTPPVVVEAKDAFIKYRNLLVKRLPGVAKMDWQDSSVKPDLFLINLDKMIGFIEDNQEKLPFASTALEELIPVSDGLDLELTEDREARRIYRNSIKVKNLALEKAEDFFYEVRPFIRREFGQKSPEYSQVKDKAVRKAAKEMEQQENKTSTETQGNKTSTETQGNKTPTETQENKTSTEKQVVTEESVNS